jgi:hypothetical protein
MRTPEIKLPDEKTQNIVLAVRLGKRAVTKRGTTIKTNPTPMSREGKSAEWSCGVMH